MNLTERDKKLLLLLGIILFLFLFGYCGMRPLIQKNKSLETEIAACEEKKMQMEAKLIALPAVRVRLEQQHESVDQLLKDFYGRISSTGIDKELTKMALTYGLEVKSLRMSMPRLTENTKLMDYSEMLNSKLAIFSTGTSPQDKNYRGIHTATVQMNLEGYRGSLQSMVDACTAMEPRLRIDEISWQRDTRGSLEEKTQLSLQMELYLADSRSEYLESQMMENANADQTKDANSEVNVDSLLN